MKTIKHIILAALVLVFAISISFAQDDVYNTGNKTETKEKKEKINKRKINTGYVFIDGKYVEPPYRVSRKRGGIYINNIRITKHNLIADKRKTIKIKKDPGSPQNVDKMDNVNAIFKDTIQEYNINYVLANYYYYYSKYPDDIAMRLIKEFIQGLPNIKTVEGRETLKLTAWNGDTKLISVRAPVPTYNKWQKQRHLRYNHRIQVDMFKDRFVKGDVYFIFPDEKAIGGYSQTSFGLNASMDKLKKIYEILVIDTITNETKAELLKEKVFSGNTMDVYLDIFVDNMDTVVLKEILKKNNKLSCNRYNNDNKIEFTSDNCLGLKDVKSDVSYSPKSNFVNIGCPDPWGSVFLGFNPSFNTISNEFYNLVKDQGYNNVYYNIDMTPNDVQTGSLSYETFKNLCTGGISLWSSHGVESSEDDQGYILVAYFKSTETEINGLLNNWFGGNDMSGFGVIEAINPNENNWGGDTPPFILVAYPEVANSLWKPNIDTFNCITMISSCNSYQNGFVQACGTNGATFGYNDVVMGITTNINNKALLKRLNGTKSTFGNYFRNTSSAYNDYPFSNLKMHPPNANITLCPATKEIFPANNTIVPPVITQGYFEIDTWCDASKPVEEALIFEVSGDIVITNYYWENGTSGKSNKIIYNWVGTQGSVTVHVHTDKIVAYGGGGQQLDFDGVTPNGETGVYYTFQIGTGTPQSVNFFADNTNIFEYTTVQFTNISTLDNPQSYHWNFGDGSTSNLQNPLHTYNEVGSYNVTLTISTPIGDLYEHKTGYITVSTECAGVLSCSNSYVSDKKVQFYATLTGAFDPLIDEYRFTFDYGDGNTDIFTENSPLANIEYEYPEYGNYDTRVFVEILSIGGEILCIKECSCNTVELYNPFPCSDFIVEIETYPELVFVNETVQISAEINNGTPPYHYHWAIATIPTETDIFYDGFTSTDESTEYTYPEEGTYPVFLSVVSGEGCNFQTTYNINVLNKSSCIADINFYVRIDGEMKETNHFITKQGCTVPIFFEYDFLNNWFCDNDNWYCRYPDNALWHNYNIPSLVIEANEGHIFEPFYFHSFWHNETITNTVHLTNSSFTENNDEDNPDSYPYLCDRYGKVYADVVNCNNIAHEDNYAYPSYAFFDAINNPPYYSSGSFNLASEVNTLVNENTTIFTACNGIILSEGFRTGNKPFIATGYGFADCYSSEVNNESKAISGNSLISCDVFPNPFKDCSNFELHLPYNSNIKIDIYDLNGNFITNILSNNLFSGDYNIDIDLKNHPPGIYYLRILENNLDFKTIKLTKM